MNKKISVFIVLLMILLSAFPWANAETKCIDGLYTFTKLEGIEKGPEDKDISLTYILLMDDNTFWLHTFSLKYNIPMTERQKHGYYEIDEHGIYTFRADLMEVTTGYYDDENQFWLYQDNAALRFTRLKDFDFINDFRLVWHK